MKEFTANVLKLSDAIDAETLSPEAREALMVSLLGHVLIEAHGIRWLLIMIWSLMAVLTITLIVLIDVRF